MRETRNGGPLGSQCAEIRQALGTSLPKNPRVHELAKELGLPNKELLDICEQLGIGGKSHSSSVQEAQADRVRRKADQLGIRREQQPEEPKKAVAKKAVAKKAPAKKAAAAKTAAEPDAEVPEPESHPESVPEVVA